jgi:hypothetical protein
MIFYSSFFFVPGGSIFQPGSFPAACLSPGPLMITQKSIYPLISRYLATTKTRQEIPVVIDMIYRINGVRGYTEIFKGLHYLISEVSRIQIPLPFTANLRMIV